MEYAILFGVFFILREFWRVHRDRKAAEERLEKMPLIPSLVVGQKVSMTKSGVYGEWGEVVEVSPEGVVVKTDDGELLRFDKDGKQTDASRQDELGFGPSPGDRFRNFLWFSAPEFQAWEIDETYFPRPKKNAV